jgi:type IX secretion system PorP/SprF family membrane protein
MLGLGLGIGLIQKGLSNSDWISPDQLNGVNGAQNVYSDITIPHDGNKMSFDSDFGAYYKAEIGKNDGFYAGLSITHLNKPSSKLETDGKPSYYARHFNLTGSYDYLLPNKTLSVQPGFILQSDGATSQFNIWARAIFKRQFWGGLSYRNMDALAVLVGYNHPEGYGGGISYDISLNKLRTYNSGTIEIYLRYCFKVEKGGTRGSYKSVRFL